MNRPDAAKALELLRRRVLDVLGVRDARQIVEEVAARTSEELEVLEAALGTDPMTFTISSACHYTARGIRARLDLARELAAGEYDPT